MNEKLACQSVAGDDGSWRFTLPCDLAGFPRDLLEQALRTARLMVADLDLELSRRRLRNDNGGPGEVLTVEQASARMRCSKDSIYRKWRRLRLGYVDPLDGKWKVTEKALNEFLERQQRR